jgi:Ribbon-helix-helix protein, copG family
MRSEMMRRPKKYETKHINTERVTATGRRQVLIYMDSQLIKDVKKRAIDEEVSASVLIERAVREYMQREKR